MADVQQAQQMIEPLMSYNPFWLRLGLVTVLRDVTRSNAGSHEAGRRLLGDKLCEEGHRGSCA